jgi:hypothetical protein
MEKGRSYTENELGEKVQKLEVEIKTIFYKEYISSFLVKKATKLIKKWKVLTGWVEDSTPASEELGSIIDKTPNYQK